MKAKDYCGRTVRVLQRHIDKGRRYMGKSCPIALALKEFAAPAFVKVGQYSASIGSQTYKLSNRPCLFISRFDRGHDVNPFAFKLPNHWF